MAKTRDTKIDINGFQLETNDCIYEIVPKYDADAPEAYRHFRTTKMMNRRSGRSVLTVPFIEEMNLWDTGLYENSPMYATLRPEDKKDKFKKIKELIVDPYVKVYGDDKLDPTNPESDFWNMENDSSFRVDVYNGKIFNTNKPDDLLKLFVMISLGKIAPKEEEDLFRYNQAQFSVENKDRVKTLEQENAQQEMDVIYNFQKLLREEPKKLRVILNYIGVKTTESMKDVAMNQVFKNFIENRKDKYENRVLFLDAVEKAEKPEGYNEMNFYREIENLYKRGAITRQGEYYYLDGEEIGTGNLKNCASEVMKSKDLQVKIMAQQK